MTFSCRSVNGMYPIAASIQAVTATKSINRPEGSLASELTRFDVQERLLSQVGIEFKQTRSGKRPSQT